MSFNLYPYQDTHELNTDWIISKIKNVETAEANSKQYAEDADAAKVAAEDAKDIAVQAKDDAVGAKNDAESAAASVADTRQQIDLLQARVDNIIPDGTQTAGNTELLDIRVGSDGTIYDSAGNAVRGQIDILNSAVCNASNQATPTIKAILNTDFNHPDYYPSTVDGTPASNVSWTMTDYVFIGGIKSALMGGMTTSQKPIVAFYDQNMSFTRNSGGSSLNINVQPGEYYCRIGVLKVDEATFTIDVTSSESNGWFAALNSENMLTEYGFDFGGYLAAADGHFVKDNSGTFFCTDYIPCQVGFGLFGEFGQAGGGYYNVVGFDENKAFVENVTRFDSNTPWGYYSLDPDTRYIRIVTTASYKTTGIMYSYTGAAGIVNKQFAMNDALTNAQINAEYDKFYTSKNATSSGFTAFSSGYCISISNLIYKDQIIEKVAFTDAIEASTGYYLTYINLAGEVVAKFPVTGQTIYLEYTAPEDGVLVFCSTNGVSYGSVQFKYKYNINDPGSDTPVFNYLLHPDTTVYEVGDTVIAPPNFTTIYRNLVAVSVTVYGAKDKLLNKKISFLGDSLTEGATFSGGVYFNVDNPYPKLVNRLLKCNTQNVGHSGYPISSLGQAQCFLTSYTEIASDSDYIVVFGGTNDYALNVPLGTIADTSDISFYGAVNLLINDIKTAHPGKQLVFMTPVHRQTETANSVGATLDDYVKAIKDVCSLCAVPVIDLNSISGLSYAVTENQQYYSDSVHPTQDGYDILGQIIASQLKDMLVEYLP